MNKKSQLAFNTIVLAAIALIVLVVMVYLLLTKTTMFKKGIGECKGRGGDCINTACSENKPILAFKGCYIGEEYHEDYNCCIGAG